MILFIKHIDVEGPDTLGDFLTIRQEPFLVVDMGAGEKLPADPSDFKAVVVLGGPMNVDEEKKYPFLKEENRFIQKTLEQKIPYFGLCLGSQLLAKAAGAKVIKSPQKEVGFSEVALTEDGKKDELFRNIADKMTVYQWHEDMWLLPAGAKLLATSAACPHQAFKVGHNAYGLQFHVEVTDLSIGDWCDAYLKDPAQLKIQKDKMLADYQRHKKTFQQTAVKLYNNFLEIL